VVKAQSFTRANSSKMSTQSINATVFPSSIPPKSCHSPAKSVDQLIRTTNTKQKLLPDIDSSGSQSIRYTCHQLLCSCGN